MKKTIAVTLVVVVAILGVAMAMNSTANSKNSQRSPRVQIQPTMLMWQIQVPVTTEVWIT